MITLEVSHSEDDGPASLRFMRSSAAPAGVSGQRFAAYSTTDPALPAASENRLLKPARNME
jgi:hypothetical protein